MQMHKQTSCPKAPLVPVYLRFIQGKTSNVTHLHEDTLLKLRFAELLFKEKYSYLHLLQLTHEVNNRSSKMDVFRMFETMFGV